MRPSKAWNGLDDPSRISGLREIIRKKPGLQCYYREVYRRYAECLRKCPREGVAVELGSGGGFVKEVIPEMVTSDTLSYEGVDQVIDACKMPFEDESLKGICMLNVFHHIPDVTSFLKEAARCLKPRGRILIIDQHPGWIGWPIYTFIHHEHFDSKSARWTFETSGPLSGANGALAWMVFKRDRKAFEALFPRLKILRYDPHTPLLYWLSGGLKKWSLVPQGGLGMVRFFEKVLLLFSAEFGAFVDIEIIKASA